MSACLSALSPSFFCPILTIANLHPKRKPVFEWKPKRAIPPFLSNTTLRSWLPSSKPGCPSLPRLTRLLYSAQAVAAALFALPAELHFSRTSSSHQCCPQAHRQVSRAAMAPVCGSSACHNACKLAGAPPAEPPAGAATPSPSNSGSMTSYMQDACLAGPCSTNAPLTPCSLGLPSIQLRLAAASDSSYAASCPASPGSPCTPRGAAIPPPACPGAPRCTSLLSA